MITKPDLLGSLEYLLALRSETLPTFLLEIADAPGNDAIPELAPQCRVLVAEAQRQRETLEQLCGKIRESDRHAY